MGFDLQHTSYLHTIAMCGGAFTKHCPYTKTDHTPLACSWLNAFCYES